MKTRAQKIQERNLQKWPWKEVLLMTSLVLIQAKFVLHVGRHVASSKSLEI